MNFTGPPIMMERLGAAMARAMGTRRSYIMAAMFAFYVAVNLFSSFTDEYLRRWGPFARPLPLLLFFLLFWVGVRRARSRVAPKVVDQTANIQQCKVLVLFLSPPGKDEPNLPTLLGDLSLKGRLADRSVRALLQASWRMPLEAVAAHVPHLEKVIVIPSSGKNGTAPKAPLFRDLLAHLLPDGRPVNILDVTSWLGPPWDKGVDFEDLKALVDILSAVDSRLGKTPAYEIMIDITGGQKPPTAAGTAIALGEGRRFQYVSMQDMTVRTYDLIYDTGQD